MSVFLTFTEMEKLKRMSSQQDEGNNTDCQAESLSRDLKTARQEAAQAQENLNVTWFNLLISFWFSKSGSTENGVCSQLCTEKHKAERRKWQEEKLSLIGQAKEAEDKRNQEMRKFIEDRERFSQQQRQLVWSQTSLNMKACHCNLYYSVV